MPDLIAIGYDDTTTAVQAMDDAPIAQLKRLGRLHSQGVLTDEEFAAQKANLPA